MHLVGFTIGTYYDARTDVRQIQLSCCLRLLIFDAVLHLLGKTFEFNFDLTQLFVFASGLSVEAQLLY